ncbi:MAG: hypothetical protein KKG47_13900 [Proteobacteria bacterium]|nr:hypothetical protein [Pseudomonadota bacterium]MBU1739102.1 hypothetical protein [Pseudomonadota bacterium]
MKRDSFILAAGIGLAIYSILMGGECLAAEKKRIIIIDSYHQEYLWSQQCNEGLSASLLKFGYLDDKKQEKQLNKDDFAESSGAIIKRLWMDTKRKKEKMDIAEVTAKFTTITKEFRPDLIFLGDDNAANYIGNQFLDSRIPIVFWGVNNTPVKYGLVDSYEKPGHNVTGVYQTTYYKESLELLKTIVPTARTFAILSDDTTTGRIHNKAIQFLDRKGELPLQLVDTVATNNYEVWKKNTTELQEKVDAFFIASSNLKNDDGSFVTNEDVAAWYTANINRPAASGFRYRVEHGWLCAVDDSGYNQGYEAGLMGHEILAHHVDPSTFPPRVPPRGPQMVNKTRAKKLGIPLTDKMGIEEYIEGPDPVKTSQ